MQRTVLRTGRAAVTALVLFGPIAAAAQVAWCYENASHAGGTAQERCENNKATFAKVEECAAHKANHDAGTGHSSVCSGAVPQTRKGTASGGSRATGGHSR